MWGLLLHCSTGGAHACSSRLGSWRGGQQCPAVPLSCPASQAHRAATCTCIRRLLPTRPHTHVPSPAALLALRDTLCQLDLRSGGAGTAALRPLWRCPQGQHLTALCAPPHAAAAAPGPACATAAPDHLVAAASAGGRGGGTRLLVFDVRRPGRPVACWEQPPFEQHAHEALTLLRWLPTPAGDAPQRGGSRWDGLLLAGGSATGRVLGCQLSVSAGGPELQAKDGRVAEKPAGSAALLLERLQAALEQQEEARQAQQAQQTRQAQDPTHPKGAAAAAPVASAHQQHGQQQQQANGAAPMDVDAGEQQTAGGPPQHEEQPGGPQQQLVPPPLRAPPPLPLAPQLLWHPLDRSTHVTPASGPPLLLVPPLEQQPALAERLAAGRLLLQKQQAAAGGGIRVSWQAEVVLLRQAGRSEQQLVPCMLSLCSIVCAMPQPYRLTASTPSDFRRSPNCRCPGSSLPRSSCWALRQQPPTGRRSSRCRCRCWPGGRMARGQGRSSCAESLFLPRFQQAAEPCSSTSAALSRAAHTILSMPASLMHCSLTPQGDIALSALQERQPAAREAQRAQQAQHAPPTLPALPLLLPAAEAAAGSGSDREGGAASPAAGGLPGGPLLPHVRGVPRALVAAVAAGELRWVLRPVAVLGLAGYSTFVHRACTPVFPGCRCCAGRPAPVRSLAGRAARRHGGRLLCAVEALARAAGSRSAMCPVLLNSPLSAACAGAAPSAGTPPPHASPCACSSRQALRLGPALAA